MTPEVAPQNQSTDEYRLLLAELFHRLNQPLTTLNCCLELSLKKTRASAKWRRDMRIALQQADNITQLMASLRELVSSGHTSDQFHKSALDLCLKETIEHLLPLAESAGDTTSSEIGKWLGGPAYLMTSFRRVQPGESGGVSVGGVIAGLVASAFLVALGFYLGLCGPRPLLGAVIALAAAEAGNLVDSILAATIEQRGLVSNEIVNFAGTAFAGAMALVTALSIRLG
jgi:uncharacterized membrane protein